MHNRARLIAYPLLTVILFTAIFTGCGSPETDTVTPPVQSSSTQEPPQENPSSEEPPQTTISQEAAAGVDKVEVFYFHRAQRCTKCICFEERIRHIIETDFQNEIESGILSFRVINLADEQETATIDKYNAVASQLFINIIVNGDDYIRDMQEIWAWGCTTDPEGFDNAIRNLITKSLKGEME